MGGIRNKKRRENVRRRKFDEQNGLCHICARRMSLDVDHNHASYATFDHVIALKQGGKNCIANLRLAHRKCNSARGHVAITEYVPPAKVRRFIAELDKQENT